MFMWGQIGDSIVWQNITNEKNVASSCILEMLHVYNDTVKKTFTAHAQKCIKMVAW